MEALAEGFGEFDLAYVAGAKADPALAYTGRASTPPAAIPDVHKAQSSSQIVEAARTQARNSQEQQFADLYDPHNPLRESYLRAKYQMFVNKRIRQNLASKLETARSEFEGLQHGATRFQSRCDNLSKRFATDVVPRKVHDFIKMEKDIQGQEKPGKAPSAADRQGKFDPNSKSVSNYNAELKLQVGLLSSEVQKGKVDAIES